MRLFELAYATRIYRAFSDFDKSYNEFLSATSDELDFSNEAHRQALLKWLNAWGCRQFAKEFHHYAGTAILRWFHEYSHCLPQGEVLLAQLGDTGIERGAEAYEALAACKASKRRGPGTRVTDVRVGSTGAAKILFAARPNAFPPWDELIRRRLGYDQTRSSYARYLRDVQAIIRSLLSEAENLHISLQQELGRSLTKLVDEYNWVTVSRRIPVPTASDIAQWYHWSQRP